MHLQPRTEDQFRFWDNIPLFEATIRSLIQSLYIFCSGLLKQTFPLIWLNCWFCALSPQSKIQFCLNWWCQLYILKINYTLYDWLIFV